MSKAPSKISSKAPSQAPGKTASRAPPSSSSCAPTSSQAASSRAPSTAPSRVPAATRLERDNIKSVAPGQSMRPSSQAPASGAGSMAPGGSSRAPTRNYTPSQIPTQSMAPGSSRVPSMISSASRIPGQSQRPVSMAAPLGTRLERDEVFRGSRVPSIMADDESMALAKSMSTVRPGSRAASEMMEKVISHAPLAVATRLDRDNVPTASISFTPSKTASRFPTQMAPSAPPYIPSILNENDDAEMAKRQLIYDELPCEEQRKQDDWASKKLADSTGNACPDNRKWSRAQGGYVCGGYGHGVTDELLSEGRGGMYAVGKSQHQQDLAEGSADRKAKHEHRWGNQDFPNWWGQWERWEGPYYYNINANVGDGGKQGGFVLGTTHFKSAEGH